MSLAGDAAATASAGARAWGTAALDLAEIRGGLRRCWRGRAAEAALATAESIDSRLAEVVGEHAYLADVLAVEGAALEGAVRAAGIGNVDDGTVAAADAALSSRLSSIRALDAVRALEQGPAAVDARTVAASAARHGPLGSAPSAIPGDPRTLASAWHRMGPYERATWAAAHPELSDAPGLPSTDRDALNRAELARVAGQSAAAGATTSARGTSTARPGAAGPRAEARMTALAAHLRDRPEARLLVLRGDGRGVVAEGNPEAAGRVITLVPGTGSSLETLGRSAGRAEAMCEEVAGGGEAAGAEIGADDGAVARDVAAAPCVPVVWQDYEAPRDIVQAAVEGERADAAGPDLRDFQEGLRATSAGTLDVVGFSFGGVVAGEAAAHPEGLASDGLLFVGAPGAVAETATDLGLVDADGNRHPGDGHSVAAVSGRWDPVPWWSLTRTYGPDPAGTPFGADTTVVEGRPDHSGYFDRGTVSLEEIGRALGRLGSRGT